MLVRRSPAPGSQAPAATLASLGPADAELVLGRLTVRWAGIARARAGAGTGPTPGAGFAGELIRSAGRPLPSGARARLEDAFGADFGSVRIHADSLAAQLAERLQAQAFTIGEDVYFGRGRYDPVGPAGFALLGHELTHVLQNRGAPGTLRRRAAAPGRPAADAGRPARRPFALGPSLERWSEATMKRRATLAVAGHDASERQALANEARFRAGASDARAPGAGDLRRRALDGRDRERPGISAGRLPGPDGRRRGRGLAPLGTLSDGGARFVRRRRARGLGRDLHGGRAAADGALAGRGGGEAARASAGLGLALRRKPLPGDASPDGAPDADGGGGRLRGTWLEKWVVRRFYGEEGLARVQQLSGVVADVVAKFLPDADYVLEPVRPLSAAKLFTTAGALGPLDLAILGAGTIAGTPVEGVSFTPDGRRVDRISARVHGLNPLALTAGALVKPITRFLGWAPVSRLLSRIQPLAGLTSTLGSDGEAFMGAFHEIAHALQFSVLGTALERGILTSPRQFFDLYKTFGRSVPAWKRAMGYSFEGSAEDAANEVRRSERNLGHVLKSLLKTGADRLAPDEARRFAGLVQEYVAAFSDTGHAGYLQGWTTSIKKDEPSGPELLSQVLSQPASGAKGAPLAPAAVQRKLASIEAVFARRRASFAVDPDDAAERVALANERALLSGASGGSATPLRGAGPPRRLVGGATGAIPIRRADDEQPGAFHRWMNENRDWWGDVAVEGFRQGGFLGYAKGTLATLAATINDPWYVERQAKSYVVGMGIGAWEGVKGMVNLVCHPIRTAEGMYTLVIHWDQTKQILASKISQMLEHASSNPELFARECGEIAGQIDVSLIGPKAIGGIKEVTGALKTFRNMAGLPGKTLWYYSDEAAAAAIKATNTIGRPGTAAKVGVFATALDPALGGSRTLAGFLAENIFLGGRLDFVVRAGKMVMNLKPAFKVATGFTGGAFRPILLTSVESGLLRVAKTISGFQFAASTPQQVTILAQEILGNATTARTFLQSAGLLAEGSGYVVLNGVTIRMDEIEHTNWREVHPDARVQEALGAKRDAADVHLKRRGMSRFDDDDPELARIAGEVVGRHRSGPGVSLDISTKYRLERMLGREIGEVRLHSGPVAEALARRTEAEAVTRGRDVYLPSGRLDAHSPEGLGLLAHEVTHVVQAGPASPTSSPRALGAGSTGEVLERVAHAIERRVVTQARAAAYPVVDGVVREAPAPAPAPRPAPTAPPPAPRLESAPGRGEAASEPAVSRFVKGELSPAGGEPGDVPVNLDLDPIETVIVEYAVPAKVSQEEFLEIVKDRILDLMREELEMDAERSGTLSWDESLPAP